MDSTVSPLTMSTKTIYSGSKIKVFLERVKLDDGSETLIEKVTVPDAVAVLPVADDGRLVFVKQYRHCIRRSIVEIPAGTSEEGEAPEDCARRELEEETGYRAGQLSTMMCYYPSPGVFSEKMHLYLATGLTQGVQNLDHGEDIEVVALDLDEVRQRLSRGDFVDGKTICAIQHYLRHMVTDKE